MTTDILAQSLHNCITRSGYQIQVWWHGNSAAFTSYKRANDELARLQRFEVPQQQALSLLDTLYNQYDAMAEQYEAMVQYIQTTFNTQKLNKVIDQLTADLLTVTQCHPQMVQQAQAQAIGATVADSVILNNITVEDEWPTLSIPLFPDDEDFCHPDSLGDLWHAQPIQQAQAQAVGATALTDSRVEYVVDVAGDSSETVADSSLTTSQKSPADYAEMYGNGEPGLTLGEQISRIIATPASDAEITVADSTTPLTEPQSLQNEIVNLPDSFDGLTRNEIIYHSYLRGRITDRTELARLAPIAPLYEYSLNVWRDGGNVIGTVTPKIGMSVLWGMGGVPVTITAITAWGITVWRSGWEDSTTVYHEHLSDLWLTEDSVSPDSIKPVEKDLIEWTFDCQGFNDDGLLCQHFVGRDTTNGNQFYRTINQHGIHTRPYKGELTLGDFVEPETPQPHPYPPTPQDYYDLTNLIGYREDGHYILQMPQDHPLADLLEAWLTLQHANPILGDAGYDVAALKNTLTLPRPKTVKKAIDFAIATLKLAQEHGRFAGEANQKLGDTDNTAWETRYIGDVVTKLEGLL